MPKLNETIDQALIPYIGDPEARQNATKAVAAALVLRREAMDENAAEAREAQAHADEIRDGHAYHKF